MMSNFRRWPGGIGVAVSLFGAGALFKAVLHLLLSVGDEKGNVRIDVHLDPEAVAIVDGEVLPAQGFKDWLYQRVGYQYLHQHIDQYLLEREGKRLQISVSSDEIATAFEKKWRTKARYKYGTVDNYVKHLAEKGLQFEDYQAEQLEAFRSQFLAREIRNRREQSSDIKLQELLRDRYGDDPEKWHVRVAFFDKYLNMQASSAAKPRVEQLKTAHRLARQRAEEHRSAILEGAEFTERTLEHSDDFYLATAPDPLQNYRDLGGEFSDFPRAALGPVIEKTIDEAEVGELLPVLETGAGVYVIHVVEKTSLSFEGEKDRLLQQWRQSTPAPHHKAMLLKGLRDKANIVKRF